MRYFNLHTHHYTQNPQIQELVNQYPWQFDPLVPYYSIGIHPWHIDQNRLDSDLRVIAEKLRSDQCLALGECGLDKRIEIPLRLQQEVFEKQIALAEEYRKPLVLHLVGAFGELLEIKKRLNVSVPIVIHGFSKSRELAKQLTENGFYLSFGKYLLRNPELREVFASVPNDRFFLETDTIEEPLEDVYSLAAQYKNMALETLQDQIRQNFDAVFLKSKSKI